ncbi:hypothetical protein Patl1_25762 [Pistacia atlantica]|uniref:Uncharacterized protein n=1 Tax=Pistacia atlantica TaxID=434234 RepID=A0ACC1B327_9ROSI|nr:hypothetical protein Patl1_25762 [Pistacia atlantica]
MLKGVATHGDEMRRVNWVMGIKFNVIGLLLFSSFQSNLLLS